MRITFVLPTANMSGGSRVAATYAKQLTRLGHSVRVISSPYRPVSTVSKVKSWLRGNGWPIDPSSMPSHFNGGDTDHRVLDRARPVTDADVPDGDVVIATWWETAE